MRLYISTLTKRFVQSASYTAPVSDFIFKRRDIEPIELYFLDEEGKITIPARYLGKALLVSGSHPEFNGKYLPTGSSENGKPVWAKGDVQIKRVAANTYLVEAAIVSNSPTSALNGRYLPDGISNSKSRYKNTANQNRIEWKPAETILGDGVLITGESQFSGLYTPDGTSNGKPRYRRQGVARISWKPQWQSISDDDLTVTNMQVNGVSFDGTYKRAPTPYNGRPRYYKSTPSSPTSILSSIQFESSYSIDTEDAKGNDEKITMLTGSGGHFSITLNGRFVKSTDNNVPGIGTSVEKWTLGNNDAYIVSREPGTYTNPYRLNLPNVGYTTSGSYLGGNNWFLDDTPHNGQPQWYFGSSQSSPICFLRYDDPTNRKWRFIQTLSGTNTTIAELTVTEADKSPIGKAETVVVSIAETTPVNGTYFRNGDLNGKPRYRKSDGCTIAWFTNGTSKYWYISRGENPDSANGVYHSKPSEVATPDLVPSSDWILSPNVGLSLSTPLVTRNPGWVKLNNSSFEVNTLNTAGIQNDKWIIEQDHWLLATSKNQSGGLILDSLVQNPVAWTNRNSTSFPANYAGDGDALAWRSYADGSYGWETTIITDQIPDRWVARQVGTWPPSPPPVDGLYGWGGAIQFYTDDTNENIWQTSGWRRSASQTSGAAIQRQTLTNPARWLLHGESDTNTIYYQAIVPADVPYGPWLDDNGDSFDDQWIANPLGQSSGGSELSSYRQSTNFTARWSLGNNTLYSETNSSSPWQALNWKNADGTTSGIAISQEQATTPAHWGIINPDSEEQYAAFDSPESPVGTTWEASANDTPPQSVIEVDHYTELDGKLAIKKNLLFNGPILAESSPWTENPDTKLYFFNFNLNSAEIDAEFDQEQESIDGMIELTWSSAGAVTSSFTLPVKIYNDVIRGHEGPPSPPRSSLLAEMTGIAIALGS